jgi:hypothetical protein
VRIKLVPTQKKQTSPLKKTGSAHVNNDKKGEAHQIRKPDLNTGRPKWLAKKRKKVNKYYVLIIRKNAFYIQDVAPFRKIN